MAIPTLTVTPHAAAQAYRSVDAPGTAAPGAAATSFADAMSRALEGVVQSGRTAESQSMQAIGGGANVTEMVAAVAQAEMALQTTMAVRDRVVQAYQDIMRMPI